MRVLAIVSEYNPFHNGHAYHIESARAECNPDAVIVVMSGNFAQRGEPTIVDKWSRTEMALLGGADLVLELPFVCATASAELFARGAVDILTGTGVATHLSFGTEVDDIDLLTRYAGVLSNEPGEFKDRLHHATASGTPYARAVESALSHCIHGADIPGILSSPNTILAVQYIRAVMESPRQLSLVPVKRVAAGYHDDIGRDATDGIASATGVRRALISQLAGDSAPSAIAPYVPETTLRIVRRELARTGCVMTWALLEQALLTLLRRGLVPGSILSGESEGLMPRLERAAASATSFSHLCELLKSKRHHRTRIQRLLTHILVGLTPERHRHIVTHRLWRYARVLGFTDAGRGVLARMREKASLPVLTHLGENASSMAEWPSIQLDVTATDVYTAAYGCTDAREPRLDFRRRPVMVP